MSREDEYRDENLASLRETLTAWVAQRPGQPIPMETAGVLEIVDELIEARAEIVGLRTERGDIPTLAERLRSKEG